MTDVHSIKVRSYNMSRIKSQDTKPEMIVRKFLFGKGFRYKLHVKKLFGKPDIVLPKYKTVIFINGCFWHAHENCKYFVLPKSKTEWWQNKLTKNKERDLAHQQKLKEDNWKVILVWECKLKPKEREETLQWLQQQIIN
jgi:DNA mismatch endonuclease (patch repair protein)